MSSDTPDVPPQAPRDNTGWAQPPAAEGPPGAFLDRRPVPSSQSLPAGAGTPLQPGPPMSVEAPIHDSVFNLGAVLIVVGSVILVFLLLVAVFLIVGSLGHHAG